MFHMPNEYRFNTEYITDEEYGNNGTFLVPYDSYTFKIVASDGLGWEHVSVSLKHRCPNWKEMGFVKDLFWGPEDIVVQYHPANKDCHPYCLHLWRPVKPMPIPDSLLVGPKPKQPNLIRKLEETMSKNTIIVLSILITIVSVAVISSVLSTQHYKTLNDSLKEDFEQLQKEEAVIIAISNMAMDVYCSEEPFAKALVAKYNITTTTPDACNDDTD